MASVDTRHQRFQYQPLSDPAGDIRLLSITASPAPEELHFDVSAYRLGAAPSYHAISYAWGTPGHRRSIWINGHQCLVGENCWYALWQASRTNLHLGSYIWIDAVCINQEDISEKGNQVANMGAIFRSAVCVLACIGPHENDSEFLFANAPKDRALYHSRWLSLSVPVSESKWTKRKCDRATFWQQTFRPEDHRRAHASIKAIADRPYFHRLWIVQEVNLAREVHLCCGEQWVDLRSLAHLAWHMCDDPPPGLYINDALFDLLQMTANMSEARQNDLWQYLDRYGELQCTDLHDKIYAIMGLWSWAPGVEPITPRYDCSLPELLVETMVKTSSTNSRQCSYIIELLLKTLRLRSGEHDFLGVQLVRHDYEERASRETSDTFAQLHHRIDNVSEFVLTRGNNILTMSNQEFFSQVSQPSHSADLRLNPINPFPRCSTSDFSLVCCTGSIRSEAVSLLVSPLTKPGDLLVSIIEGTRRYLITARESGARMQMTGHAFVVPGPPPNDVTHIGPKDGDGSFERWRAVFHILDLIQLVHTQWSVHTLEDARRALRRPVCHQPMSSYLDRIPEEEKPWYF